MSRGVAAVGLVTLAACGSAARRPVSAAAAEVPLAVWREEMAAESDLAYDVAISGFVQPRQRWTRIGWTREEAVLAVAGDRITRVRVTYHRHAIASAVSGSERAESDGELAGRTFLVAAAVSADVGAPLTVTVTDAAGEPVARAIADQVRADHRWVGRADPIAALVARTPLEPGARVELDEGVLAATVGDAPPAEFRGAAIVRRIDTAADGRRTLVLDIDLASRSADAGRWRIANHLEGTLTIDLASRRALSLDAAGSLHRFERVRRRIHAPVVAAGSGHARLRWTARYGPDAASSTSSHSTSWGPVSAPAITSPR
jgi:hypothetical protein